jgi:hypothetical protein
LVARSPGAVCRQSQQIEWIVNPGLGSGAFLGLP